MKEAESFLSSAYGLFSNITIAEAGFGISIIAVLLSLLSIYRSRKFNEATVKFSEVTQEINEKTLELNKDLLRCEEMHVELTRRQLDQLDEQEALKRTGDLSVMFEKVADQLFKLYIKNTGSSVVKNIEMTISESVENNPLWDDEITDKLPFANLNASERFFIKADATLGKDRTLPMTLTWINEDGSIGIKQYSPSF